MPVSCVNLESDAYLVCLTHTLSTEREEVMGLLIGEVDENRVLHISAVIVLRRSDKQPDRVEISPEQLSDASTKAEKLAQDLNRPMRVIGWYHSHPHITVWPSHVDVRTQAMYQMMDDSFVGLIFSVFNENKNTKHSRIQVTCFQAVSSGGYGGSDHERYEVPLKITPSPAIGWECLEALVALPGILKQEEEEAYHNACTSVPQDDLITRVHNSAGHGMPSFCVLIYGVGNSSIAQDEAGLLVFILMETSLAIVTTTVLGILVNDSVQLFPSRLSHSPIGYDVYGLFVTVLQC